MPVRVQVIRLEYCHKYTRTRWLHRLSPFSGLAQVRPDTFTAYLARLSKQGRSPITLNHYRNALYAFLAWCIGQGWLTENPLASVPKARIGNKRPRRRRAFTLEEFRDLLASSGVRGVLYRVAGLSGLRKSELYFLEKRDVVLSDRPQLRLRAEATKAKRADVVPILPELAEALAPLVAKCSKPTDRIFRGGLPIPRTFNYDLKRAGIAKRDDADRQVDFHSLRYFFCWLVGRKLPIQVVKYLMRHQDIRTTCNLYLQLGIEDVSTTLLKLPPCLNEQEGGEDKNTKS